MAVGRASDSRSRSVIRFQPVSNRDKSSYHTLRKSVQDAVGRGKGVGKKGSGRNMRQGTQGLANYLQLALA